MPGSSGGLRDFSWDSQESQERVTAPSEQRAQQHQLVVPEDVEPPVRELTGRDLALRYSDRYERSFGYRPYSDSDTGKANTLMDRFIIRYGLDMATQIVDHVFDRHNGTVKGEPFNVGRFAESQRWLTDMLRHEVISSARYRSGGGLAEDWHRGTDDDTDLLARMARDE
jgi:hypothetical protein